MCYLTVFVAVWLGGEHTSPSLPGLTPQVGFTRLAARSNAELGQARVPVQSIFFARRVLRSGWTRGSSPIGAKIRGVSRAQRSASLKGAYARLRGLWASGA